MTRKDKAIKELNRVVKNGIGTPQRLERIKARRLARRQHQEPEEPEASNNLTQIDTECTQL